MPHEEELSARPTLLESGAPLPGDPNAPLTDDPRQRDSEPPPALRPPRVPHIEAPLSELSPVFKEDADPDDDDGARGDAARDDTARDDTGPDDIDSPGPISLGPLGLLGFGPRPDARISKSGTGAPGGLLGAAALVIVIGGLKLGAPVLVPLVLSVFVATLAAPLVLYLKRHRIAPLVGVPSVVLLFLGVVGAVTGLVVGSLNALILALPDYQKELAGLIRMTARELSSRGLVVRAHELYEWNQPGFVMRYAGEALSQVADFFSTALLVAMLSVFVLLEALTLPAKLRRALDDPGADLSRGLEVVRRVKDYVVVKTWLSLATGVSLTLGLELQGLRFALLWGVLGFVFNYVPNVGGVISAVPAIVLSLLQFGFGGAAITAGICLLVHTIIGNVLEPAILGQRMNQSPLVVFASLVFWGWLWGPVGMFLSVPLTMSVQILLESHPETRPFAILLAGADAAPAPLGPLSSRLRSSLGRS